MKYTPPFILLLTGFLLISAVSGANITNNFTSTDTARITHSYQLDPGTSAPWEMFILSGIIGLVLLILALTRPKAGKLDYEVDIILSVFSWPFIGYFAWSCLKTGIDRIAGTAAASTNGATVMITQHIIYIFPLEGWLSVIGLIFAVIVTLILIAQFRMFNEQAAEQKT